MIRLVSNKLSNEKILLENKLEKLMNGGGDLGVTSDEIIDVLKEIASLDSTGMVWESYLPSITDNSKNKKN